MQSRHQIIEAIVNVSEGRRPSIITDLIKVIDNPGHVKVIHADIGHDVNRTVLTIVGKVNAIFSSLDHLITFAKDRLDITMQEGEHPRLGMIDVIPFVALENIHHEELIEIAKDRLAVIADKHGLPMLYYGDLDVKEGRALFHLRKWEMKKDLGARVFADVGPQEPHDQLGVSCATVRPLMTAYNVNLATRDLSKARKIVSELKRLREDEASLAKLDTRDVRYLAWFMPKFDCCQVSTNIYDVDAVSMSELYDHVRSVAEKHGVSLGGSELIGLAAERAITTSEDLGDALSKLKLGSVKPFHQDSMILDKVMGQLRWSD